MGAAVAFEDLPESVRSAVVGIAADVIARVPADALPPMVRPLARFAPAKRARTGAVPLSRAVASDAGFRALVASGMPAPAEDVVLVAAHHYLADHPDLDGALSAARAADETASMRARIAELTAAVDALAARLAAAHEAGPPTPSQVPTGQQEIDKLRRRLRDQGSRHRAAADEAASQLERAVAERDEAVRVADRLRAEVEALTERLEAESRRSAAVIDARRRARRDTDRQRADADGRVALLLDTVVDAAAGLRAEWRLRGGGARPADTVVERFAGPDGVAARPVDASALVSWLGLPHAHLVVDGYNVTKTGYPELTLAEQRDRLVRALGAIAARTGCEVTVVFDGAAVVAPAPYSRGVRVVFSPAGVIADDVIRELVAAEPPGRVVVVVTSDREIVDWMRGRGIRTAASSVLLDLGS